MVTLERVSFLNDDFCELGRERRHELVSKSTPAFCEDCFYRPMKSATEVELTFWREEA